VLHLAFGSKKISVMCGRYAQGRAIPELVSRYAHLGAVRIADEAGFFTGFNIAPTTTPAVLVRDESGVVFGPMQWGFVPHWAKSLDQLKARPINARSETADTSGMFRHAFQTRRCIVPAMGFYEWQGKQAPKQPYFIHSTKEEILSFAGLWARWRNPDGGDLLTFTILTTEANPAIARIHDRMPCILDREDEAAWIAADTAPAALKELLRPYPGDATAAYPVSPAVNKAGQGGAELLQPLA